MKDSNRRLLIRIRILVVVVIIGLAVSGITAFPIQTELEYLNRYSSSYPAAMQPWLHYIGHAVQDTNYNYPSLSYGTDWLAFAHLMLAILFIGPLKDPVRNIWVIEFGIIACILIVPLAFIAGPIRHIPVFWRLIDCSFGLGAIIPLAFCWYFTKRLHHSKLVASS